MLLPWWSSYQGSRFCYAWSPSSTFTGVAHRIWVFSLTDLAFASSPPCLSAVLFIILMFPLYECLVTPFFGALFSSSGVYPLLWLKHSQRSCFCRSHLSPLLHLSISSKHGSQYLREGCPLRLRIVVHCFWGLPVISLPLLIGENSIVFAPCSSVFGMGFDSVVFFSTSSILCSGVSRSTSATSFSPAASFDRCSSACSLC